MDDGVRGDRYIVPEARNHRERHGWRCTFLSDILFPAAGAAMYNIVNKDVAVGAKIILAVRTAITPVRTKAVCWCGGTSSWSSRDWEDKRATVTAGIGRRSLIKRHPVKGVVHQHSVL